jgi:hypothetical protein
MLTASSWKGVYVRHRACTRRGQEESKLADGMMPSHIVHRVPIRPAVLSRKQIDRVMLSAGSHAFM